MNETICIWEFFLFPCFRFPEIEHRHVVKYTFSHHPWHQTFTWANIIAILTLYSCMALGGYQSNWWLKFLIRKMKIITVFSLKVIIWNKGTTILRWICMLSRLLDISKAITTLTCKSLKNKHQSIYVHYQHTYSG